MSQFFVSENAGNVPPPVATSYTTDNGTAIPALNVLQIKGIEGISTRANPNNSNLLQIFLNGNIPLYRQLTHADSPYTVDEANDFFLSCDTSGGSITIKLPNSPDDLSQFIIKDRTGNVSDPTKRIIIQSAGGAVTIDQQLSYTFTDAFESLDVMYHNNNYESF